MGQIKVEKNVGGIEVFVLSILLCTVMLVAILWKPTMRKI